ncbi:4a-hydroxytetrahydrobiopterin dehydratase [Streptomyces sp. NPDC048045]|uniref:4a-hydroxytetrahydrobiopterin dehydratase n=1 Tax=Streptomyces sp. NPDC048045 TaxID=3154710 RepID=UPI003414B338
MTKLTGQQIADAGLDGWVHLLGGLQTRIDTRDFATGLSVVDSIGRTAEGMNHHPDLDLRRTHVDVRPTSHGERGVTDRDIRLAREISSIAATAGVQLECANISRLELGSEEPRQRRYPDVWVDPAQVQSRVDAALAVGGTLVSDAEAPSFWVLADPEGNRVCLCTWQDRG